MGAQEQSPETTQGKPVDSAPVERTSTLGKPEGAEAEKGGSRDASPNPLDWM